MSYQHVVSEGLASLRRVRQVLCQASRLVKEPARTGWVYAAVSRQAGAHVDRFHPAAAVGFPHMTTIPYYWNGRNVTDFAQEKDQKQNNNKKIGADPPFTGRKP